MGGVCVSCFCSLMPDVCCSWFAVSRVRCCRRRCWCVLLVSFFGGLGVCRVMVLLGVRCCLWFVVRFVAVGARSYYRFVRWFLLVGLMCCRLPLVVVDRGCCLLL